MAGNYTPVSGWCLLRDNANVRAAIEFRMKQRKIKIAELSRLSGVPATRISRYLNNLEGRPTQHQMLKILKALGLFVDLKIEII